MKNLTLTMILISLSFSVFADGKINRFKRQIQNECTTGKSIPSLLLKKSLIELIRGEGCSAKFTTLLIGQCSDLNCNRITDIYNEIEQVRAGAVIGDE